jgi:hypothetical protein
MGGAAVAFVAWMVHANAEYRRHVKSLSPEDLEKFKKEERDDMQLW